MELKYSFCLREGLSSVETVSTRNRKARGRLNLHGSESNQYVSYNRNSGTFLGAYCDY
jgi:hypothetical protein